jgi:prepilin-type processing-associated H-X9-DG protein
MASSPTNGLGNATTHPNFLYVKETLVTQPSQAPLFMDSVWINLDPLESDAPARSLYDPVSTSPSEGMPRVCIARHGDKASSSAPKSVPPGAVLPGTIDMGFVDGHVEQAKLQELWNYPWHLNWVVPSMRPP